MLTDEHWAYWRPQLVKAKQSVNQQQDDFDEWRLGLSTETGGSRLTYTKKNVEVIQWMCNHIITHWPTQHSPNFVKTHRHGPLQRCKDWWFPIVRWPNSSGSEWSHVRKRDEELDAFGGRRQSRDAVRAVFAECRIDLHKQVEKRRRDFLQSSEQTPRQDKQQWSNEKIITVRSICNYIEV